MSKLTPHGKVTVGNLRLPCSLNPLSRSTHLLTPPGVLFYIAKTHDPTTEILTIFGVLCIFCLQFFQIRGGNVVSPILVLLSNSHNEGAKAHSVEV